MSHALDVPCKLRWDVHELGQWNDATVLYPCDRVSTGTDSRAVTRMVPDDLGGGDKGGWVLLNSNLIKPHQFR